MKRSTHNMLLATLIVGTVLSYNTKIQLAELKNNMPIEQPQIEQQEPKEPKEPSNPEKPNPQDETWREYSGEEYQEVLQKASKENKEIILFFTADWCKACKQMKSGTLTKENVKQELKNYLYVVVNTDKNRELTATFKINSIPTMIKLKSDGTKIGKPIVGNRSESEFLNWISAK